MVFNAQTLLAECTLYLETREWVADFDEANFPRFQKNLIGKAVSFCFQVVGEGEGRSLLFIAQVTDPQFSAAFGAVAGTKFNDIGIANKAFRAFHDTPSVENVLTLVNTIEDWANNIDTRSEIIEIASLTSTKTHENLKHFAALGLCGHRAKLEDYLSTVRKDHGRFGKAGAAQIEAALSVAAAAPFQNLRGK